MCRRKALVKALPFLVWQKAKKAQDLFREKQKTKKTNQTYISCENFLFHGNCKNSSDIVLIKCIIP